MAVRPEVGDGSSLGSVSAGLATVRCLASSWARRLDGIRALLCAGGPPEPLAMFLPDHSLSVPLGANPFELEWHCGHRSRRGRLGAGAVSLFPALQQHSFRVAGHPLVLNWYITPDALLRGAAGMSDRPLDGLAVRERFGIACPRIQALGRRMAALLERVPAPDDRLEAEALQAALIAELVREHSSRSHLWWQDDRHGSSRRIRRVVELLHASAQGDESPGLDALAGEAGLSPYHFTRQFKRLTGQSPHQFLIGLRIERARLLLADGRLSLVEVALRLGFSSQSHFSATFRRHVGTTPRAFRVALTGTG